MEQQSKTGIVSLILGMLGLLGIIASHTGIGILFCIAGAILAVISLEDHQAKHGTAKAGMLSSIAGVLVLLTVFYTGNSGKAVVLTNGGADLVNSAEEKDIYSQDGISIRLTEVETKASATSVNFTIYSEADQDYSVEAQTKAVNGVTVGDDISGSNSVTVSAGKTAEISIVLGSSWMQENGIDKCSDMDVVFAAYDADGSSVWDSGEIAIALE
jgi:NADH:ubiquinone oxidoreductase subunit K